MTTQTPRTDALARTFFLRLTGLHAGDKRTPTMQDFIDLARSLERELAGRDAILTATTEFAASLSRQITDRDATIARLREALEAVLVRCEYGSCYSRVEKEEVTAQARAALRVQSGE